jgi:hypothetical protein
LALGLFWTFIVGLCYIYQICRERNNILSGRTENIEMGNVQIVQNNMMVEEPNQKPHAFNELASIDKSNDRNA